MKYKTLKSISILSTLLTAFSVFGQTPTPTKSPTPVASPSPTPAQTPKPANPLDDGEVIKVESRLVVVPVSVTDAAGQPVLGLKAQDFSVKEEGNEQEIDQVRDAEKVPLEIAILFDISASTDAMFQFEQETAAQFLKEVMRPEDRATIISVGDFPYLIQPSDTAQKSAASINSIVATKSSTAFYDSVSYAANYLQKNSRQGTRKVIIVISDGDDTNSNGTKRGFADVYRRIGSKLDTITREEEIRLLEAKQVEVRTTEIQRVSKSLQNADTVFYSINPAGGSVQLNKRAIIGQSNMQNFADQTGGTAFLPKFQSITLKDALQNSANAKRNKEILTQIFKQLANELQAQYLVQYYSEASFSTGKYVRLGVGLKSPSRNKVRARQGYFVKN